MEEHIDHHAYVTYDVQALSSPSLEMPRIISIYMRLWVLTTGADGAR